MRANSHVLSSTDQEKGKEGEIGSRHETERGGMEGEEGICLFLSLRKPSVTFRGVRVGRSVVYGTLPRRAQRQERRVIEGVESCQVPEYTKSKVNTQMAP